MLCKTFLRNKRRGLDAPSETLSTHKRRPQDPRYTFWNKARGPRISVTINPAPVRGVIEKLRGSLRLERSEHQPQHGPKVGILEATIQKGREGLGSMQGS